MIFIPCKEGLVNSEALESISVEEQDWNRCWLTLIRTASGSKYTYFTSSETGSKGEVQAKDHAETLALAVIG